MTLLEAGWNWNYQRSLLSSQLALIILPCHLAPPSPLKMTLLEAGWNWNYQKSFLRLFRNKGALAALPLHRKIELARFFCGSQLRVRLCRTYG